MQRSRRRRTISARIRGRHDPGGAAGGHQFAITPLPAEPAFTEPKDKWWLSSAPCPTGTKLVRNTNPGKDDWNVGFDCVRGDVGDGPLCCCARAARFREGYTVKNKPHGLERQWFPDGTSMRRTYRGGTLDGPFRQMHANGKLDDEGHYASLVPGSCDNVVEDLVSRR